MVNSVNAREYFDFWKSFSSARAAPLLDLLRYSSIFEHRLKRPIPCDASNAAEASNAYMILVVVGMIMVLVMMRTISISSIPHSHRVESVLHF